eukprot:g1944.t1
MAASPLRDTLTALCDVGGCRFLHRAAPPRKRKGASPASPTQLTTQQIVVRVEQDCVEWRLAAGSVQRHRLPLHNITRVRVGLPHEFQQYAMYFASGGSSHVFCLCTTRNKFMVLCAPNARKLDKWVGSMRQEVFRTQHVVGADTKAGLALASSTYTTRSTRRHAARSLFQDRATNANYNAASQLSQQSGLNKLGRKVLSALDPICHAASCGDSVAVQNIVNFERPNATAIESALFLAASAGHDRCVEPLLRVSASFFCHADGTTVMHAAVKSRNAECVRIIAQYYFDLADVADAEGNTPLHLAVKNSDPNCLLALLQSAAETNTSNKWGKTPLALAREERRKARRNGGDGSASKIVRMLKNYGRKHAWAEISQKGASGNEKWQHFEQGAPAAPHVEYNKAASSSRDDSGGEVEWESCWDADSERWYWYNSVTGESVWHEEWNNNSNGASGASYVSTVPPIEAESPGTASDTGNQVYETCYDEATGRWYYVNVTTGHSMWADEWSDMSVGQSSSRGEVSAATETPQSLSASQCWPMSPPAPLGTPESNEWETHFDTNNQQYYYVNQVTGDSMWADALLHATVTDSHHTGKVATVMMNYDALSPATSMPAAVLASAWEVLFDAATGCYYHLNTVTGESQWVLDGGAALSASEDNSQSDRWEKVLDADSGRWYWVDGETGESVWAEETNDAAGPFSEDSAWDQRVHVVQDEWETFIDESGNPYEISRATGDSRWVT